jgi:hypothetical protein
MAPSPSNGEPRPDDPAFLFVTLIAARKSGDKLLESLVRDWLAAIGIRVQFWSELLPQKSRKAVRS